MKMTKIALIATLVAPLFVACDNQQQVVPQTSALTFADSTSLGGRNMEIHSNSKVFSGVFATLQYNDNIAGNAEQPETFGEYETRIERFVRFNAAGAYSFQSAVDRFLIDPGADRTYRYRLGFRIDGSVQEGGNNPVFALPTTTPSSRLAPSPDRDIVSDAQLEQAGLKRLYAFIGNNGRDFVFAAEQEAQNLLREGSGYVNVSRGFGELEVTGIGSRDSNIAEDIGTPNSTDLLIFTNGDEPNTAPLFRYRNTSLGTHVHLVGSNNPEAQAFIDFGFIKEEPELGYVYKQ